MLSNFITRLLLSYIPISICLYLLATTHFLYMLHQICNGVYYYYSVSESIEVYQNKNIENNNRYCKVNANGLNV